MKENITHHHLERIEASVAAISAALGLDRRDAYAYAYTRGRTDAATGAVRNKNINNTTDENKTKQVNSTRGSDAPPPAQDLSLGYVLANAPRNVPPEFVRYWFGEMERRGWQMRDGRTVNAANWKYSLGSYFAHASDEERERIRRESLAPRRVLPEAAVEASHDWRLCAERCANCREGGGCGRGVAVPPAWQARPHPPEECPRFAAKSF